MSTFTVALKMIVFVDEKRRIALLQLPRDVFPPECRVGAPYGGVVDIEGDSGPNERKIAFQVTDETLSFGRKVPPLAWVIVLGIDRVDDILGRAYQVRNVRDATPDEAENVRVQLTGGFHPGGSVN